MRKGIFVKNATEYNNKRIEMDIIERLEQCLNTTKNSPIESDTEKTIKSAIEWIKEANEELERIKNIQMDNEFYK